VVFGPIAPRERGARPLSGSPFPAKELSLNHCGIQAPQGRREGESICGGPPRGSQSPAAGGPSVAESKILPHPARPGLVSPSHQPRAFFPILPQSPRGVGLRIRLFWPDPRAIAPGIGHAPPGRELAHQLPGSGRRAIRLIPNTDIYRRLVGILRWIGRPRRRAPLTRSATIGRRP
jgi:hypothetical protein